MRHINRSFVAVVLVLALAVPAGAATRPSRPGDFVRSVRRFVVRVLSRVSPPVGSPTVTPDDPQTTSTSEPVQPQ